MSNILRETVTEVRHWTDTLFSFRTTRNPGLRFESGQFAMIGLEVEGKPLMRAYSLVGAHYDDHLEFLSIIVPNGPLTSRLRHISVGDTLLVNRKVTGTLLLDNLLPGKNLWLLSTGTGIAPFLSIIHDPATYELFDKVILTHTVRRATELVYQDLILRELPENEFFGEDVRKKLVYYPTVTREDYKTKGRITDLIRSGRIFGDVGLPSLNAGCDRVMICGNPSMTFELRDMFIDMGWSMGSCGEPGHFVIEKAFAER